MFYDLNVACDPRALNKDGDLARTLSFLAERKPLHYPFADLTAVNPPTDMHTVGYNVVALNHTITGKLPADLVSTAQPSTTTPRPPHTNPVRLRAVRSPRPSPSRHRPPSPFSDAAP